MFDIKKYLILSLIFLPVMVNARILEIQGRSSLRTWALRVVTPYNQPVEKLNVNGDLSLSTEQTTNEAIFQRPFEKRTGEGLRMLVLHPSTGKIKLQKMFNTGEFFGALGDLLWHFKRIQNGTIIAFVITGYATIGIREAADVMHHQGSLLVHHLQPNSKWTWIFIKGGKTLFETCTSTKGNGVLFDTKLFVGQNPVNYGRQDSLQTLRLCEEVDGLGDFCNAKSKDVSKSPVVHNLPNSSILDNVPVIVTGGYRLPYLHHTISSLLKSPGVRKHKIEVFLGDTNVNVLNYLDLINIKYTRITVSGEGNNKLFQFYRSVYQTVATRFRNATAVIFLDEDVDVSSDFFSYMSQVIPLLHMDKSLYCVSAHVCGTDYDFYHENDKVKRVATQVLWGYALTIDFIDEAVAHWPQQSNSNAIYDYWMYDAVAGSRECVNPDVSRVKHFGAGLNTRGSDLEKVFQRVEMTEGYNIPISNIKDVTFENWSILTKNELLNSEVIYGDPCTVGTFTNLPKGNYTFPYSLEIMEDETIYITSYFMIGECLNFYAQTDSGWHGMVTPMKFNSEVTVYFIGVPASPYSKFVNYTKSWDYRALKQKEKQKITKIQMQYDTNKIEQVKSKYRSSLPLLDLFNYYL